MYSICIYSTTSFLKHWLSENLTYLTICCESPSPRCPLLLLSYPTPGLSNTWFIQHLVYLTPGLSNTWFIHHLVYPTPGLSNTWFIQHLVYLTPGFSNSFYEELTVCCWMNESLMYIHVYTMCVHTYIRLYVCVYMHTSVHPVVLSYIRIYIHCIHVHISTCVCILCLTFTLMYVVNLLCVYEYNPLCHTSFCLGGLSSWIQNLPPQWSTSSIQQRG